MGKTATTIIDRFDGGISDDRRVNASNKFALTKHFDAFSYAHKLIPHFKTEEKTWAPAKICKFVYGPSTAHGAGEYRLFGFGVKENNFSSAMISYDIDSGFTNNWEAASVTAEKWESQENSNRSEEAFFYYKNYIYTWQGNWLTRYDTTGSANYIGYYNNGTAPATITQPVLHPSDDCAYFFHDNLVDRLNGTAAYELAVLTLPADLKIMAACSYGNYLAIGCTTKNGSDIVKADAQSVVFLWDRDSSLTYLSQRIDLGRGELIHLAMLDNVLLAVINNFVNGTCSLGRGKILVKQVAGDMAVIVNEILTDAQIDASASNSPFLPRVNFIRNNKLYFPMRADLNGDERCGIWVMNSAGAMTLDYVEEAASLPNDDMYVGIYMTGNIWWIARLRESTGVYTVTRTDDAATYSTTMPSIYESLIFNSGDASQNKKLIGVTVMTEPLPAAGQIVLKYRADTDLNDDTAWTTVFTNTTNDSTSHGAINIEATGNTLPEYQEIQFRIESTGGAVPTGYKFTYEVIDKQLF